MTIGMDQDGAKLTGTMEEIRFRDQGDGTVEVTMSDTYPISMTMTSPETGAPQELAFTITQPGLKLVASGSATETAYAFDGPNVGVTAKAVENGKPVLDMNLTLAGMTGSYNVSTSGGTSKLASDLKTNSLNFSLSGGEDGNTVNMTGAMTGLSVVTAGNFLDLSAMENIAQALKDGFSTSAAFEYGAGNLQHRRGRSGQADQDRRDERDGASEVLA